MMSPDQKPEWITLSRRTSIVVGTSVVVLSGIDLLIGPLRQILGTRPAREAIPLEAVPTLPPVYPITPAYAKPLEKGQRQAAERKLTEIEDLLGRYLSETIFIDEDRARFSSTRSLNDEEFTLWVRDAQRSNFREHARRQQWQLSFGPSNSHRVKIEQDETSRLTEIMKTHIRAQLTLNTIPGIGDMLITTERGTEVREDLLESFMGSVLKIPSNSLEIQKSNNLAVRMGLNRELRLFRGYVNTFGVAGVIMEAPIRAPEEIVKVILERPTIITSQIDPFDIPEIIFEGIPGSFPRG